MSPNYHRPSQVIVADRTHRRFRGTYKTIALAIGMLLGLATAIQAQEPASGRGGGRDPTRDLTARQTDRIARPLDAQDREIELLYDQIMGRARVPLSAHH